MVASIPPTTTNTHSKRVDVKQAYDRINCGIRTGKPEYISLEMFNLKINFISNETRVHYKSRNFRL